MKKHAKSIVGIVLLLLVGYFVFVIGAGGTGKSVGMDMQKYSQPEIGLSFTYKAGAEGYIIDERVPAEQGDNLVRVILLHRTQDVAQDAPVGGEGSPLIAVGVFRNSLNQSASVWALENEQYSTINLKVGEITETVVGGANAIYYLADGLYPSDNIIVAHGGFMYVITGQFMDPNASMRGDFASLVNSIVFIQAPGQE